MNFAVAVGIDEAQEMSSLRRVEQTRIVLEALGNVATTCVSDHKNVWPPRDDVRE